MNMSYCRFENTNRDLVACRHALEELLEGGKGTELSRDELSAAKMLVNECVTILELIAPMTNSGVETPSPRELSDALEAANKAADCGADDDDN